jgi:hypothetical protein
LAYSITKCRPYKCALSSAKSTFLASDLEENSAKQ